MQEVDSDMEEVGMFFPDPNMEESDNVQVIIITKNMCKARVSFIFQHSNNEGPSPPGSSLLQIGVVK